MRDFILKTTPKFKYFCQWDFNYSYLFFNDFNFIVHITVVVALPSYSVYKLEDELTCILIIYLIFHFTRNNMCPQSVSTVIMIMSGN